MLTLKKAENENRLKRKEWGDKEWEFWSTIENIILVGGLASSNIGESFKYYIEKVFKDSGEKSYNIMLIKDSSNIGINGCAAYIKGVSKGKTYLIFDCGQTFIKRSLVKIDDSGVRDIRNLTKVLSKHVEWNFKNIEEERNEAGNLHKHILNTILDTVEIAKEEENDNIGDTIVINIANYVRNGAFANRGGYGKLRLIAHDCEKYLSSVLYEKLKKSFCIKLVHDGTAMANAFLDYPNSVCISLGTAFGVGFPVKN
ncbi:hypothetical protein [Clostridium sp. HBUAS56017]|uniref:hypothetical protein n=1 Tax=Clostridium sp. HBUAS56017 TaxID=2571128 RepID=UPI001FAB19D9|nr:hypothetical protein [Clostridium sp. HBUAS56017]